MNRLFFLILVITVLTMNFLVFLFMYKKNKIKVAKIQNQIQKPAYVVTSQDIRAIAGEDMISTQLDLARAYIEIGKKQLAKKILDHALMHGNVEQQEQAKQLLISCG